GTDPQSIEEIGKHFAVTKKRIYQIEEGAFRKLKRYFPQRGKRPVRGIPRRGPRESQVEPALFFYNLPLFKFFREEAAAFGFTRFYWLPVERLDDFWKLIGVGFVKSERPAQTWKIIPDLLVIFPHFARSLWKMYQMEVRRDKDFPETRALVRFLLEVERARVRHAASYYNSISDNPKAHRRRTDILKQLASQSYLDALAESDEGTSAWLRAVGRFLW